jgi:16S rRNA (cytosine1402-N4)-methyltransferase
MAEVYHIPALLSETLEGLNISPDGTYVDVTLGGGGHSRAILERLGERGRLFSLDQDADALVRIHNTDARWTLVHGNFRYVRNFMDFYGVPAWDPEDPDSGINGLLADLGVSFHHFDEAERGFSFRFPGPLDMRMNRQGGKTAADIVNTYSEEDLARVLYLYGELKNSRQLARRIVARRPLNTTQELVTALTGSADIENGEILVDSNQKKDLARAFQALRMEVNDETAALREMLEGAKALLKPGGRIAVLTYHSLEDRIVKNFLKSGNAEGKVEKDFYGNPLSPFRLVNRQVITATDEEIERNPRARSAKLRVAEKIG